MTRVTLRDVADQAGVSVRTVSNVVNEYHYVAAATRQAVQRAIAELGYRPNIAARQLRQGQGVLVRLVLPELDSPYFSDMAARFVRAAADRGWTLRIEQTDGDRARERTVLANQVDAGADAVIFSPWSVAADEIERGTTTPPVVMLGERPGVGLFDHVAVDNVAAADEATAHLLATGCRRVAAIGCQPQLSNETARLRLRGYRQALRRAGIEPTDAREMAVPHLHRADGAAAMQRLLNDGIEVDGIFCFSDQLALGAMHTLASAGYAVPDEVAVCGFDDIEAGRYNVPGLTTVSPDKDGLVAVTLGCVADRLNRHALDGRERTVGHRVLARGSTTPVSISAGRVRA